MWLAPNHSWWWWGGRWVLRFESLISKDTLPSLLKKNLKQEAGQNEDDCIYLLNSSSFFFFPFYNFIFIFGCASSSLLHKLFSSCSDLGLLSSCGVHASRCSGFSCCGTWALGCVGFSSCSSRPQSTGSVVVAHGVICPIACGIIPNQGWNPCLPRWQVDSLPLSLQRSPPMHYSLTLPESL